jgi:hypothetical protein
LVPWDAVENLPQTVDAMLRELDGHIHSIDDPAQDQFDSAPGAVPLEKLLHGDRLTAVFRVICAERAEDIINGMKESSTDTAEKGTLRCRYEVIHKDVDILQGILGGMLEGRIKGLRDGDSTG